MVSLWSLVRENIAVQAFICAALAYATLVFVRAERLRGVLAAAASAGMQLTRVLAAAIAWLFDRVMPVDGRNGRLPPLNFAAWMAINLAIVAAWIVADVLDEAKPWPLVIASAALVFALLNLLLLGAAYWALRESAEVMNGELPVARARFSETSTARNAIFFFGTAVLLVAQIAVAVEWVEHVGGIPLVVPDGAIAIAYANVLIAVVDALPLVNIYVAALARHAPFAPDVWGMALQRGLNGMGSILLVCTAFGFIQQRLAFRRMVGQLVNAPDGEMPPALRERFKNAPAAIKSEVLAEFHSETDDRKRLRLAQLAVDRRSFRFPGVFTRLYAQLGDPVRKDGATLVAGFLDDPQVTFTPEALESIFKGWEGTYRDHGRREVASGQLRLKIADYRDVARILVPAAEALAAQHEPAAAAHLRSVAVQKALGAALDGGEDGLRARAARLLITVNTYTAIPALLKAVPLLDEATAKSVLDWAIRMLGDRGIVFSPRSNATLLRRMAIAARDARRQTGLPVSVDARLEKVGERIEKRLQAAAEASAQPARRNRRRAERPRAPPASIPQEARPGMPVLAADGVRIDAAS